jgi:hypothetical protein
MKSAAEIVCLILLIPLPSVRITPLRVHIRVSQTPTHHTYDSITENAVCVRSYRPVHLQYKYSNRMPHQCVHLATVGFITYHQISERRAGRELI